MAPRWVHELIGADLLQHMDERLLTSQSPRESMPRSMFIRFARREELSFFRVANLSSRVIV